MAVAVRLNISLVLIYFIINASASWVGGLMHHGFDETSKINTSNGVTSLVPNVRYNKQGGHRFTVCCFKNVPKSVLQIWRSVQLIMLSIPEKYEFYYGANESEVRNHLDSKSYWQPAFFHFSGSDSVIDFPAFTPYCVGIDASEEYSFLLKVRTINYWKVLQLVLGIFLFLASPDLSRNSFFHYAVGVSVGVFASILILLYIFSRFIPQRGASYAVLLFGYSLVFYFLKMVWHHLNEIATSYMDVVLCYCVVTAFLSFILCYRIGPVKNDRTRNIIQWLMQAVSLVLIFFSSEYREVSTAVILLLLTMRTIPARWIEWTKYQWFRFFPPKIKLLTDVQYTEQGLVETKKALEDLRQYCSSPDCNVWRVVRRLKDPGRFATFVEAGSHYTDQELLDYNSEDFEDYFNDENDLTVLED